MRYRIYFRHDDSGKESAKEVDVEGLVYRICDDHGRVVFGEPWPKQEIFIPTYGGKEPMAF